MWDCGSPDDWRRSEHSDFHSAVCWQTEKKFNELLIFFVDMVEIRVAVNSHLELSKYDQTCPLFLYIALGFLFVFCQKSINLNITLWEFLLSLSQNSFRFQFFDLPQNVDIFTIFLWFAWSRPIAGRLQRPPCSFGWWQPFGVGVLSFLYL